MMVYINPDLTLYTFIMYIMYLLCIYIYTYVFARVYTIHTSKIYFMLSSYGQMLQAVRGRSAGWSRPVAQHRNPRVPAQGEDLGGTPQRKVVI